MPKPQNIQYSFSKNIPWTLDNGIVVPKMSREIFTRTIDNAKAFYVICPGYLLESIVTAMSKDLFVSSDVKINGWIMPNCYAKALQFFNFKYKGSSGNMFSEHRRLKEAVVSYPTPVFMDEDDNVYFNLLFNYGKRIDYRNAKASNNTIPFWKQIFNNTFLIDNYRYKSYDIDLSYECKTFVSKNGIDTSKRFLIIDNSNLFGVVASGLKVKNTFLFPEQARNIAGHLYNKGIQCVVMTSNRKDYFGKNLFTIDPWSKIDSLDLLALLSNAYGIMSSDPNIYLSAAIVGCKKILCNDAMAPGWTFDDLEGLCDVSENWFGVDNPTVDNIIEIFSKEVF